VAFTQYFRPEAETLRCARGEVLDEDVGLCQEAVQNLSGGFLFQVQGKRLFGTVDPDEVAGKTLDDGIIGPGEVSGLRALHLDDPRAHVGELARGERRGDRLLQRDDRDALQRQRHQNDLGRPSTCSAT
jgi:hypothetical protein